MFRKLFGKKKDEAAAVLAPVAPAAKREIPLYSELIATPSRRLPDGLRERETSEPFRQHSAAWQKRLLEGRRPTDEQGVFVSLGSGNGGVVTFGLPDDGRRAVLYFSSPLRATDYRDSMGPDGASAQFLSLTLPNFLKMLRDLEKAAILDLTLDRCPRCPIVTVSQTESIQTIEQAWTMRCTIKGAEIAREQLYFSYALDAARAEHLDEAREVALEAVGHVTIEDPNMHLLLGQIAVAFGDTKLAEEAKTLLGYLRMEPHAVKLASVIESGVADFEGPPQ